MSMPKWFRFTLLAALLLLLAAVSLAMQYRGGTIEGVISNDDGPVAGAVVDARHTMSGEQTQAISGADGRYRLDNLRAGRYSLWVHAERHTASWIQQISVEQGKSTRQDVRLARLAPSKRTSLE